jgi:hypothetical protein
VVGVALVVAGVAAPVKRVNGPRVRNRQRAAGAHPRLIAFLDWWDANGPIPITVGENGGVRTDPAAQLGYYLAGTSGAATLDDTPHGRGAAMDLWPYIPGTLTPDFGAGAESLARYLAIGEAAERFGLVWGGRWTKPDRPHVELPGWRQLPYPPLVA